MRYIDLFAVMLFVPGLVACSTESSTGPVDVRWDREVCIRCSMAIGDPHYSAQIRGGESQKTAIYKFDDIGCAIVWLNQQSWKDNSGTEIWVNAAGNGDWLDAKTAFYVKNHNTPMDYGLGAQKHAGENALSFEQAVQHILESDGRFGIHKHHQHSLTDGPPVTY